MPCSCRRVNSSSAGNGRLSSASWSCVVSSGVMIGRILVALAIGSRLDASIKANGREFFDTVGKGMMLGHSTNSRLAGTESSEFVFSRIDPTREILWWSVWLNRSPKPWHTCGRWFWNHRKQYPPWTILDRYQYGGLYRSQVWNQGIRNHQGRSLCSEAALKDIDFLQSWSTTGAQSTMIRFIPGNLGRTRSSSMIRLITDLMSCLMVSNEMGVLSGPGGVMALIPSAPWWKW